MNSTVKKSFGKGSLFVAIILIATLISSCSSQFSCESSSSSIPELQSRGSKTYVVEEVSPFSRGTKHVLKPGADLKNAHLGVKILGYSNLVVETESMFEGVTNLIGVDINGADVSRAFFEGINMTEANLNAVKANTFSLLFPDAERLLDYDVSFEDSNLTNATIDNAVLPHSKFIGADLTGASLVHTDLQDSFLISATLFATNFRNSNLSGSILQESDLRCSVLEGANLSKAFLSNANLEGSNLRNADLSNSYLSPGYVEWNKETLLSVENRTVLRSADLRGANLSNADLQEVDFTNANLEGANIKGANLRGAILKNAIMPDGTLHD